jgi:hypothetical protein
MDDHEEKESIVLIDSIPIKTRSHGCTEFHWVERLNYRIKLLRTNRTDWHKRNKKMYDIVTHS